MVPVNTVTMETVTMGERNVSAGYDVMKILQIVIACLGVLTNLIVVIVFLHNKQMRRKIPNVCIINQVSVEIFQLHFFKKLVIFSIVFTVVILRRLAISTEFFSV